MQPVVDFIDKTVGVFGVPGTRVLAAGVIIGLTLFLNQLFTRVLLGYVQRLIAKTRTTLDDQMVEILRRPVGWLIVLGGLWAAQLILAEHLNPQLRAVLPRGIGLVVLVILTLIAYRASKLPAQILETLASRTRTRVDDVIVPYLPAVIQAAAVLFGFLVVLATIRALQRTWIVLPRGCPPACLNANLTGKELSGYDLAGARLTEANLREARLVGADLRGADLSGATLAEANLRGGQLNQALLIGADLRAANLGSADLEHADLGGADLAGANLTNATLRLANLASANLADVQMNGIDLHGIDLRGVRLSGAKLSGANLSEANLGGDTLSAADLSGALLNRSNLAGTWLNLANLTSANLQGANLSGASLYGANLAGADLSGAQLLGVNLAGAKLNGADLRGADLGGATLLYLEPLDDGGLTRDPVVNELNAAQRAPFNKNADLRGAQYDARTRWPDGFSVPPEAVFED